MIRDSEANEIILRQRIQSDSVGRNRYLSKFIGSLNTINRNIYISLDGDWGSGKSVFVRQLEYLNRCNFERDFGQVSVQGIESSTIGEFQDKYTVFYYNAWENDHHIDPLQSLLFSLIEQFYTGVIREDKVNKLVDSVFKSVLVEGIKKLTGGLVNIDDISQFETMEQLVSEVTAVNKRKDAVSEIISTILPEGKKLLFVIDELDRCNPEFAVRLLEVAKHYYNDDNMIFLIATNNRQLAHTIKKYYGNDFDGYGYLDKLFDLPLELPDVDMKQYFNQQLAVPNNIHYVNIIPIEIAMRLHMSMREANRYNSLISFIRGDLDSHASYMQDTDNALTAFLFIPLALALKIRSIDMYDKFVLGEGSDVLRRLFTHSDRVKSIVRNIPENAQPMDVIVERYAAIMNSKNLPYDRDNQHTIDAGKYFNKTLPLIDSIEKIDDLEKPMRPNA